MMVYKRYCALNNDALFTIISAFDGLRFWIVMVLLWLPSPLPWGSELSIPSHWSIPSDMVQRMLLVSKGWLWKQIGRYIFSIVIIKHFLIVGVLRGKGRIPVADYSLATQVLERMSVSKSQADESNIKISKTLTMVSEAPGIVQIGNMPSTSRNQEAQPPFIGDSFNKARTSSMNGDMGNSMQRGVYSFCMCPGGQVNLEWRLSTNANATLSSSCTPFKTYMQIVPTSTNVDELCINGMSFR